MNSTGTRISSYRSSKARDVILRLLSLLTFCGCAVPAGAQHRFDVWTADNGLPQNIVRGIHQTPDGYLWIATLDGAARFDGVRFQVFNRSNTSGIVSNRFSSMVGGRGGDLWLTTEGARVTRYHQGVFQTYDSAQGAPAGAVHGIAADASGDVWLLLDGSIARWSEESGRFVEIAPTQSQVHYKPFRWENTGFWGWDEKGLHCFYGGRFVDYTLPSWLPGRSLWEVAIDQDKTLWLETIDGRHISISDGKVAVHPEPVSVPFVDHQGHAWMMRIGHQLYRSLEEASSGLAGPQAASLVYLDRENSLWLGTEGQGLFRLQEQSVHVYSKEQGLVDRNVYPIYQDQSGAVWIGAWGSGLSRLDAGRFANYTVAQGLPNGLVTAICQDREGRLWVATHEGLSILKDGRFQRPDGPAIPGGSLVQAIYQDHQGTLWFGTSQGLVSYQDGATKVFTTRDGIATDDVRVIGESGSGDLWVGGYGGLTRLHRDHSLQWTRTDALAGDNIRSVYEDPEGVLWIGTYDNGLARLKDGKLTRYSTREGLFNNGVFQILDDGRGNLWMSCNRGIYRVSKQDLNAYAADTRRTISSVAYGRIDGMLNVECNGGLSPAGIKARDGKLWFPTQNGVAVIDPERVSVNRQPPPVVIESSMVDHVPSPVGGPLRIQPGKENVEINYTALSFIKSDQIQFKYKLEGLDDNWIDAGLRRTAYFSHLPPGNYVFRVIAGNSDGVWNLDGQSLAVVVLTPFYKTMWFRALLLVLAAALLWGIVSYRFTQLRRVQEARQAFSQQLIASQESERKRIAAELHDSLGQRLVVINNLALFSLRARGAQADDDEQSETIREISSEATLAIEETRSISYNLRPFQLDRLGLTKAIEGLIRSVSKSSGIQVSSDLANIDELFPEELRINFYRIVQEALSNIMKHAQATEVKVSIAQNKEHTILSIQDNGKGFAPSAHTAQTGPGGFGLTGMAERASLLGGTLKMRSEPGVGTVMTVEIPAGGKGRDGRSSDTASG